MGTLLDWRTNWIPASSSMKRLPMYIRAWVAVKYRPNPLWGSRYSYGDVGAWREIGAAAAAWLVLVGGSRRSMGAAAAAVAGAMVPGLEEVGDASPVGETVWSDAPEPSSVVGTGVRDRKSTRL